MNPLTNLLLAKAITFGLIVGRFSGFVVVSPFPGTYVSNTQRVGLVLALSWIVTLFAPEAPAELGLGAGLVVPLAVELGCGAIVGFAFRLVLSTFEIAGAIFAQSVGLSSAATYNPGSESQSSPLEQVFTLFALALALSSGVHRIALAYLLESFRALPVGGSIHLASATSVIVDLSFDAFRVGLKLAMPVLGIGLIVQIGLALLARAAPSMQIFNVGLSVLLATGLLIILGSIDGIGRGMALHLGTLGPALDRLLVALSAGGGDGASP
jgi:flagellar biosynthetic protein FliR